MQIKDRPINLDTRPYLIAEMSGNHNRSIERALEIVDAAADSGADAIKLQTYTADTMTLDVNSPGFVIDDDKSPWAGRQLHDLYQEAHTPWEWHEAIMERAALRGIHCFSSPFDRTAVDFLQSLDVPAYKIASFEITDLPLVRRVASTGKPIIISTGMATIAEIDEAARTAREGGCSQVAILKCTSTYPASPENSNVRTIGHMRQMLGCEVGLSDHTMGCGTAIAAVACGATLIEKHFTLHRADGGVDSAFSLEPKEFETLRIETDRAWQSLGSVNYGAMQVEEGSRIFRRSLYITKDIKAGTTLSPDNVRIIRPGFGLSPKYYDTVIGRRLVRNVTKGTPITWDLFN